MLILALFASCDDDGFLSSEEVSLSFSTDTLMFDTIFTTIGSTTKSFRVINPHNRPVLISSIELAGGNNSPYRLNIDGIMSNSVSDVELPARDSIFIFVELTVDPNGSNQPMIIQDSVVFLINSEFQDIDLLAWGQDFIPVKEEVLSTTTWTADKPYLVYNYALVDTGAVLTIEPGARIHFHKDAILAAMGTINAVGTHDKPITFQGDRLEALYSDIPAQWHGIILSPNEEEHVFENVILKNGWTGLQIGNVDGAAKVKLHNMRIEHMGFAGIVALQSEINASNLVVSNCGSVGIALYLGGKYRFNHTTVANYWRGYSNRNTPSIFVSNMARDERYRPPIVSDDLIEATWQNSIIWGSVASEVDFEINTDYLFNVSLNNSLVKVADSIYNAHPNFFVNSIRNQDPAFVNVAEYNYQLLPESPAINAANIEYSQFVPYDLNLISRLADDAPDIGAFEYVKEEEEEDEDKN